MAHARTALNALIWLIEEAFEGDPDHSLLANIRDLREDEWTALPTGANRSIDDILEHVGWSKWMYEEYAFGRGMLRGDQPPLIPAGGIRARPHGELLEWLTKGHQRWLA
jgi:hypothetical protein